MSLPQTPPRVQRPCWVRFSPPLSYPILTGVLTRLLAVGALAAAHGCYLPLLFFLPQQCPTTAAPTQTYEPAEPSVPEHPEEPAACDVCDVSPGSYAYEMIDVGNLGMAVRVAFHPSGSHAIVLERANVVHILGAHNARFTLAPTTTLFWTDIAFAPSGDYALITGRLDDKGALFRFDDAAWQAGISNGADLFVAYDQGLVDEPLWAVTYPPSGMPVVLSGPATSPTWARLRAFDPDSGAFSGLHAVQFTTAGCNHMAYVEDGTQQLGILVGCGVGGGDYHYWRDGWTARPGGDATGNLAAVAAHPSGKRALVVDWSGRSVRRFSDGLLSTTGDAFHLGADTPWGAAFATDGSRALIVGNVADGRGSIVEYRDGYNQCRSFPDDCDLRDVSPVGFPTLSSGTFYDIAYQPGCAGGLVVGGYVHLSGSRGYVLRFSRMGGTACGFADD